MENNKKILFAFVLIILFFFYLYFLFWFEFRIFPFSIKNFLISDLNNDGREELALIVWKKGSYGSSRPFWLKNDTEEFSMRLFLYKFRKGKPVPLWHSSRLEKPICEIRVRKAEGKKAIEVWEGSYQGESYSCGETERTFWSWNGWGFSKI